MSAHFFLPKLRPISYSYVNQELTNIRYFGWIFAIPGITVNLRSIPLTGRSGASSISIPAAISSARTSIISSSNRFRSFLKLAIRFICENCSCTISPLCSPFTYRTNLRSLSSAVRGLRMSIPLGLGLHEVTMRDKYCAVLTAGIKQYTCLVVQWFSRRNSRRTA